MIASSSRTLVSAIILNYRTPQEAIRCVEALVGQSPPDARYKMQDVSTDEWLEILVVDNHSEDDSIGVLRNRLRAHPIVRILETPQNLGFSGGYNLGIRHARGTYILINNPTKRLAPGAIARMVAAMEANPTIGIIGPKMIQEDGSIRDSARSFPDVLDVIIKRTPLQRLFTGRMRRYRQLDADPDVPRNTDWAIGGCLLIRRSLFETIGSFDRRFFLFFEDIDLCRRAKQMGHRVHYLPTATATDRKRRLSEGGLATLLATRSGRAHIASALKYFWKWRRGTWRMGTGPLTKRDPSPYAH